MLFDLLSQTYLIDAIEPILKYVTYGFIGALILFGVIFALTEKEHFPAALGKLLFTLFSYLLAAGVLMLTLTIVKKYDESYLDNNYINESIIHLVFIPLLATAALALIATITIFVSQSKNSVKKGLIKTIALSIVALAIIASLVLILVYFNLNIKDNDYYINESTKFNAPSLWISAALIIAIAVFAALALDKNGNLNFTAKDISYAGVALAMSFALSYIRIFRMPKGGSVTLVSMLPVMLFAYSKGLKKGLFVGFVYGLLQSIQDPFIIHPAQFLLDYPIAFTMLGVAAIGAKFKFKNDVLKFSIGALVAGVMRYIAHVLSGTFAFGAYAEGADVFTFSLFYNSVVLIDTALVIVAGALLLTSKNFKKVALQQK